MGGGFNDTMSTLGDITGIGKTTNLKELNNKYINNVKQSLDPAGVFMDSKDANIRKFQQDVDIFGIGARPREEARVAKENAAKAQAEIDAKQAEIDAKQAEADSASKERKDRLKQKQLLTGSATGVRLLKGVEK